MIKKYYIEEEDGKEVKRKQTIHEFEDWQDLPHKEQIALVYELSAKMLQQAKLIDEMTDVLEIQDEEDIQILNEANRNFEAVEDIL